MAEINQDTPQNVPSNDGTPDPKDQGAPPDPKDQGPDYKALHEQSEALREAEKARADAAEALIVKNKNIQQRKEGDPQGLTEERVREIVLEAQKKGDDSPEAKILSDAQAKVKKLEGERDEAIRALAGKEKTLKDPPSTQHDPLPEQAPKLPDGSPLKDFKHLGNGLYSMKLSTGKTMFKNTKAQGNERKSWIE